MNLKIPKLVGFLLLMVFIFVVGYLLPYTLVLGNQGLSEPEVARTIDFFIKLLYGGATGIFVIYLVIYLWKGNNKYGDSIGFFNLGDKPSIEYFGRFTAPQLTTLAFIFFSLIFLVANILNLKGSLTSLKFLPQQFSPLDSLALSTAIIPIAENLLLAFAIGVLILIFTIISIKYNLKESEYGTYVWFITIVGSGIFGVIWHSTVYIGSSVNLFIVFVFWAFMGFLAIATGLWTIPYLVHVLNNFFLDFNRIFASDTLLVIVIAVILIVVGGSYYLVYKGRLFGEKQPADIGVQL